MKVFPVTLMPSQPAITQLLHDIRDGHRDGVQDLMPLVYDELREIAHRRLSRRSTGDTLNTTALVHEAYLKMVDQTNANWQDRAHFFAAASRAMRFIVIDYVRRHMAAKRGGGQANLPLHDLQVAGDQKAEELLHLNEALKRLEKVSSRLGQLIEYKFFGGLTFQEIGEVMNISERTAKRDWARARLWLFREMKEPT